MAEQPDKSQELKDYEDLQKKLKVIKGLREKVGAALDKVYEKGKITPKEVTDFLNNPANFTAQQYTTIEKSREEIMAFIWDALGTKQKKKYETKKLRKKGKKRSRKSLGHRRKWLQMD